MARMEVIVRPRRRLSGRFVTRFTRFPSEESSTLLLIRRAYDVTRQSRVSFLIFLKLVSSFTDKYPSDLLRNCRKRYLSFAKYASDKYSSTCMQIWRRTSGSGISPSSRSPVKKEDPF